MARYGVPYLGSKSRIAPWVVERLPSAETFVDLFAGGCAVTHAALSKRLMEVMAEIDALPDPEAEASPLDAAKRKRGDA